MQTAILAVLWRQNSQGQVSKETGVLKGKMIETGDDINGIYKTCMFALGLLVLVLPKIISSKC